MTATPIQPEDTERFRQARLSRDCRFDGQFFVAVKSTGIFCRPVCPARLPKEENVDYYYHAAQAMHAGFRPCLRCRPDSAPLSGAWNGVNTTVKRAETLLSAIPPQPVTTIAERLGISERYLRKLISSRLGMPPAQWQKYQQLLFAKRLLQQSDMSVESVAAAAGFGSARRLQAAMKQTWAMSPGQIRGSKASGRDVTPVIKVMLYYRPPYNWKHVQHFLSGRAIGGTESVTDNTYRRVFSGPDGKGTVVAEHQPQHSAFAVTLVTDFLQGARAVLDNLSRVLDLHADPHLINQALIAAGIPSGDIVQGLRLPGVWSEFEAGCRAVLGQQVSVKAAVNNVALLVSELGETAGEGRAFPLPQAVASSELTFLRMPGARKQALRNLAGFYAQEDRLTDAQGDKESTLLALKGIGPWTIDYLMMRGVSDPDRYLSGDLIVRKVADKLNPEPQKAAPWRSYLTLQLWHMADQLKQEKPDV